MFKNSYHRRHPTTTSTTTTMSTTEETSTSTTTLAPNDEVTEQLSQQRLNGEDQSYMETVKDQVGDRILQFLNENFNIGNRRENKNNEEDDGQFTPELILWVGGALVCLHLINRSFRAVYYHATSQIDQAARDPQRQSWKTTFWYWTERVLRRAWIPLWFTHESIQHDAIKNNLENHVPRRRLQQLRALGNPGRNIWAQPIYSNTIPLANNINGNSADNNSNMGRMTNCGPSGRRPFVRYDENR